MTTRIGIAVAVISVVLTACAGCSGQRWAPKATAANAAVTVAYADPGCPAALGDMGIPGTAHEASQQISRMPAGTPGTAFHFMATAVDADLLGIEWIYYGISPAANMEPAMVSLYRDAAQLRSYCRGK